MLDFRNPLLWLGGLLVLALVVVAVLVIRHLFNAESRARRRRLRSHGRVVSRRKGRPSIKLAVDTDPPKRPGKR